MTTGKSKLATQGQSAKPTALRQRREVGRFTSNEIALALHTDEPHPHAQREGFPPFEHELQFAVRMNFVGQCVRCPCSKLSPSDGLNVVKALSITRRLIARQTGGVRRLPALAVASGYLGTGHRDCSLEPVYSSRHQPPVRVHSLIVREHRQAESGVAFVG